MERVRPCEGVCRRHLLEDQTLDAESANSFGSVVRMAQRTLEGNPDILAGDNRWPAADVRGCLTGPNGGVSGVLGLRGHDDVLWSSRCRLVATNVDGSLGVARCSLCKDFYRRGVTKRTMQASRHTPHRRTRNDELSTAQKVRGSAVRELAEGRCCGIRFELFQVVYSVTSCMPHFVCAPFSSKHATSRFSSRSYFLLIFYVCLHVD